MVASGLDLAEGSRNLVTLAWISESNYWCLKKRQQQRRKTERDRHNGILLSDVS